MRSSELDESLRGASGWWERAVRELALNTRTNYKGALKRYVLPRMGHYRLSAIDTPAVNKFKNDLLATGKGAARVRYAVAVLSAISADAVLMPRPGAFVFPHPCDSSRPWADTTYRNWRERTFKVAATQVGISAIPYDLRHSFVSLMLAAGTRRREVAEQAGHSLAVMESTYAHVIAEFRGVTMDDPARAILEARVSPVCHATSF